MFISNILLKNLILISYYLLAIVDLGIKDSLVQLCKNYVDSPLTHMY